MSKNPLKLKIAYLYPDILHGYCDSANIEAFIQRAKWREIDVQTCEINANDKVQASKFDFYYIGGSNTKTQDDAIKYLIQNQDELKIASIAGVPMLAVNCGYQLFGNYYRFHNQAQVDGIKILDVDTISAKKHHYGNFTGICEFLNNRPIVGFKDHKTATILKSSAKPFLKIKSGYGNNHIDKTEGARFNNVIGTYITSALLPQNPHLCDFFIATALRIKYKYNISLTGLCDDAEWYSHNYILESR